MSCATRHPRRRKSMPVGRASARSIDDARSGTRPRFAVQSISPKSAKKEQHPPPSPFFAEAWNSTSKRCESIFPESVQTVLRWGHSRGRNERKQGESGLKSLGCAGMAPRRGAAESLPSFVMFFFHFVRGFLRGESTCCTFWFLYKEMLDYNKT